MKRTFLTLAIALAAVLTLVAARETQAATYYYPYICTTPGYVYSYPLLLPPPPPPFVVGPFFPGPFGPHGPHGPFGPHGPHGPFGPHGPHW